jgi:nucleotide-binding universal stress UspA family protein
MSLHGPVLVGTNLSPNADEALRQGAQLAQALGSQLLVCHVVPELLPDGSVFQRFRRANANVAESVLGKARAAVHDRLGAVLTQDPSSVDIDIAFGTPHAGLLSLAEEAHAGVVVMGPGSTAINVVRHLTTTALIARSSPQGPVVGATDFSDPSLPALHAAADEARRRGVGLHLVHVFDIAAFSVMQASATAMPYLGTGSALALEGLDDLRTLAETRLRDALSELGVPGETSVVHGTAAGALVEYAETVKAGLVVVGTHGRSGLARLTLGSTAASVIESAPCSVLVVRLAAGG